MKKIPNQKSKVDLIPSKDKKPIISNKFLATYIGWDSEPIKIEKKENNDGPINENIEETEIINSIKSPTKTEIILSSIESTPSKEWVILKDEKNNEKPVDIDSTINFEMVQEKTENLSKTQFFLWDVLNRHWKKHFRGIYNLGATCYINSIFQILFSLDDFIQELLKFFFDNKTQLNPDVKLMSLFVEFIAIIMEFGNDSTEPLDFFSFKQSLDLNFMQFKGNTQHDVHEFFFLFLSFVDDVIYGRSDSKFSRIEFGYITDITKYKENKLDNLILDHFSGVLENKRRNLKTDKVESENEIFYCLSLPIPIKEEEKYIELIFIPYDIKMPAMKLKQKIVKNEKFKELINEATKILNFQDEFTNYFIYLGSEEIIQKKIHFNEVSPWDVNIESQISKKEILIYGYEQHNDFQEELAYPVLVHFAFEKINKNLMGIKVKSKLMYPTLLVFNQIPKSKFEILRSLKKKLESVLLIQEEIIIKEEEEKVQNTDKKNNKYSKKIKEDVSIDKSPSEKQIFSCVYKFRLLENDNGNYCCGTCKKKACNVCLFNLVEDQLIDQFNNQMEIEIFFSDLYDINEVIKNYMKNIKSISGSLISGPITLNDCLDSLFNPELIETTNDDINIADDTNSLIISCKIKSFPKYLFLHLKRFKNSQSKIESLVSYQEKLEYFSNDNQHYHLIGIVNHEGDLSKGHYYSYVKEKDQWYEYNDIKVEKIEFKKANHKLAYILIYKSV